MTRKAYILLLLFAAWPVNNLYRFFMRIEAGKHRPFLFNEEVTGLQWYLWHTGGALCYIMIFWALWLYMTGNYKRERDIVTTFGAIFMVQCSDIIHYVGWQRHSPTVLFIQGFIIVFAGLILVDRHYMKIYGSKR